MPTAAGLLSPGEREAILQRLAELAELADIAKTPPLPADPDSEQDQHETATEGRAT